MWANEEVSSLVEWLRHHNDMLPDEEKIGFYGLDVYSLWDSLGEVIEYLERVDPDALPAARLQVLRAIRRRRARVRAGDGVCADLLRG